MSRVGGMKQTSEIGFEPDWLSLREPVDHRSRDQDLLRRAAGCVAEGMTILDLGSGTGSTARAFANAGFSDLNWRFVDNDPALLRIAASRHPNAQCVQCDLSRIDGLDLNRVGLITASALFDLMPESWVDALVKWASAAGIPVYTALNYDGVMRWSPADPHDEGVTQAFNQHQRTDKGLGLALGPEAGSRFARVCAADGYAVSSAQSPWHLGAEDTTLHAKLLAGIAQAAHEVGKDEAQDWAAARQKTLSQTLGFIGHTDHLAVPR